MINPKKKMETLKAVVYILGCLGALVGYAVGLYASVYNRGSEHVATLLEPRLQVMEARIVDIQNNVSILMKHDSKIDRTSTETNLVLRNK